MPKTLMSLRQDWLPTQRHSLLWIIPSLINDYGSQLPVSPKSNTAGEGKTFVTQRYMTSVRGSNTHTGSSHSHTKPSRKPAGTKIHWQPRQTSHHVHIQTHSDGQGPSWSLTTDSLCRLTHQSSAVTGQWLRPIIYPMPWLMSRSHTVMLLNLMAA